jgi:hypothetical protein
MLFEHKANVNIVDSNTKRSVFYTYMLEAIDDHILDVSIAVQLLIKSK